MTTITQNNQKDEKPEDKKIPYMEIIFGVIFIFFVFAVIASTTETSSAKASSLIALFFTFLICYICCKYSSRKKEDKSPPQQQQQQVIQIGGHEARPMRVCPKCGLQNDRENKFCADCGNKLRD
jgi:protein-S-isoprenylcysteine O-methyltransferase Ste14